MQLRTTLPLIVALAIAPQLARAQDDPRKAQAEAVFAEGLKQHDAGHEQAALAKFEEAYRIYPSPNVLFNVGREEQLLGKGLEAIRHYRVCLSNPLLNPSNAALGKKFVAELEIGLGRIDIVAPLGAKIVIDGAAQLGASPFDVAPGEHVISITAKNGKSIEKKAHLDAGDSLGIDVTTELSAGSGVAAPAAAPASAASPGPAVGDAGPRPQGIFFPPPTGALIIGGVGLIGIGVGVGFGLSAMSKHDSATSQEASQPCTNPDSAACHQLQDTSDGIHTASSISIASYIVGGALVAGGVVWWAVAPRQTNIVARFSPFVGPKNAGLGLNGSF